MRKKKKKPQPNKGDSYVRAGRRRSYMLAIGSLFLAAVLISRLYYLQIVKSDDYQKDFASRIRRTVVTRGTRGRILDRTGKKVLARSESIYNVTMNDLTDGSREDDRLLNSRLQTVIDILDENGDEDKMVTDFSIELIGGSFYFKEGMGQTAKTRFLADVYGYADPADMPEEDAKKTAEEVINDLADRFGILSWLGEDADRTKLLEMTVARYNLSLNYYQKYISTTLAVDVSDSSKEAIEERFSSSEDGIQIEEDLVRVYKDPVYFSNIIGYTGEISESFLEEHTETDEDGHPLYREGDVIGLAGIEASQEDILHARSGQETFNVDSIGRVTDDPVEDSEVSAEERSYSAKDGQDVQLTIDYDLQISVYKIIENNLRNIILSKLYDSIEDQVISEDDDGSKIGIPVSNVYVSCLTNIIDSTHFTSQEASETERDVQKAFENYREDKSREILKEIRDTRTSFQDLDREMQTYQSLLEQALYDYGVVPLTEETLAARKDNDVYLAWEDGKESLYHLVREAARLGWVDTESRYIGLSSGASDDDILDAVMDFFEMVIGSGDDSLNDRDMRNAFYKYLIINREVSGNQVCHLLLDQDLVDVDDDELESFNSDWGESDFTFIYNRIRDMDLTPAELHLYPSTASAVVTDPESGDVLAMVSYPGFDTNRINDESYYQKVMEDPAKPLLNYATQQLTAPGSTFKMVTATAALSEEVINLTDKVNCKKKSTFTKVKEDPNPPKCWIYPKKHGKLNLEGAIANSCNMFFYEMGYRLGTQDDDQYNSVQGVEKIQKYAAMYGLDQVSGVEVSESEPSMLSADPIRGAIGQDTNAYTTAALARYVSTVANRGTNYKLTLLDWVGTEDNEIEPLAEHTISLEKDQWNAIQKGMRRVASGYSAFNVLWERPVAGKTGTAQQTDMPDNALFVGYAPYYEPDTWAESEYEDLPKIALAVRIPNGYSSSYAAQLASDIIRYYYYPDQLDTIVDSIILNQGTSND